MANCFLNCCQPPGMFCVSVVGCGIDRSAFAITVKRADGTTITPISTTPGMACYAAPAANITITFDVTGGFSNPGPVTVGAVNAGTTLVYESRAGSYLLTSDEDGRCCGHWPNVTLTYSAVYPYPGNSPFPPRAGWYSPIFHESCSAYDPGLDVCLRLTCPEGPYNQAGYWQLSTIVTGTGLIGGLINQTVSFAPPPSGTAARPFGCPISNLYIT